MQAAQGLQQARLSAAMNSVCVCVRESVFVCVCVPAPVDVHARDSRSIAKSKNLLVWDAEPALRIKV